MVMSQKKENTPRPTTGKKTLPEKPSWIKEASPDDPIYTRGFMIGGRYLRKSSKDTDATSSDLENREQNKT